MDEATDPAFASFYRGHHPRLVTIALGLTGDAEMARDLVQEGFLRAYAHWAYVAGLELPEAWVRRVVVNLCIDVSRRRMRDRRWVEGVGRPEVIEAERPESAEVWVLVRALPARQRSAVALRYLGDLSVRDVAETLGVTEGTVKVSLHRAHAALARRLGRS